jgi:AcrR family transcriptional regulator
MSSDRRRGTREERDAVRREAREAAEAAKRRAKEAAEVAKRKAKDAARQAGETAREEAMEAAFAAKRDVQLARDRALRDVGQGRDGSGAGVGLPAVGANPFGLLWEPEEPAATTRGGRARGSGLNREEILVVALRVADAEGPEAVSMRRIAKELGVGTMSLYHHVPTKDDLLDLMHDRVMGELIVPEDELAATWPEALAQISRRTRDVYSRHTWMVSGAWERPQFGPRAFAHIEQSLQIMSGVPQEQAMQMLGVADDYVIGFVSRHVAAEKALARAGMDEGQFQEALRPYVEGLLRERADEFPALAAFTGDDWSQDADERFEAGLRWLIAGMAAELQSGA